MSTNIPLTGIFNVTCEYKRKNGNGLNWKAGYHTGIDLTCDNDIIYGTCNGYVEKEGFDKSYGNYVCVKNTENGTFHWYCHLSKIDVIKGQKITRTTKIGLMGATGNVTGKHLHFEIRKSCNCYGEDENPADYMGIENKVQTGLNTENYQIKENTLQETDKVKVGDIKKFKVNTNLRENTTTDSTPHLYLINTTVEILKTNVANQNGYIWDKVKVVYAKPNDFSIGYVARTKNRYV